jgi:replication-associated recombination protein RarA
MTPSKPHLTTGRGYDFYEVTSSMQKEIRRGNVEHACYWAHEFLPRFETYVWKRLKIIANEDIGTADPFAALYVDLMEKHYYETADPLCLINAVTYLARSKKSRMGCHLSIVLEQRKSQGKIRLEVPDYALDRHTARGKRLGRDGWKFFREEGAKLVNKTTDFDDPYEDECFELLKTPLPLFRLKAVPSKYASRRPDEPAEKPLFHSSDLPDPDTL